MTGYSPTVGFGSAARRVRRTRPAGSRRRERLGPEAVLTLRSHAGVALEPEIKTSIFLVTEV